MSNQNFLNTKNSKKSIIFQILGMTMMTAGILLIVIPVVLNWADNKREPIFETVEFILEEDTEVKQGNVMDGLSAIRVKAATLSAKEKSDDTISRMHASGKWIATDYISGDIGVGQYEVKRGDTLWEISEAVYGNGDEWHKILERNSEDIGFLSDGSQALIVPGQILIIAK